MESGTLVPERQIADKFSVRRRRGDVPRSSFQTFRHLQCRSGVVPAGALAALVSLVPVLLARKRCTCATDLTCS